MERPRLFLGKASTPDRLLHWLGELFSCQQLEEPTALDPDCLSHLLPRDITELLLEPAQGSCAVERIEILAQDVLHELLNQPLLVTHLPNDCWNGSEASQLSSPPASLPVDDHIAVASGIVTDSDGLEHALQSNGGSELLESLRIEAAARLVGIGLDAIEGDLARLGQLARAACLG